MYVLIEYYWICCTCILFLQKQNTIATNPVFAMSELSTDWSVYISERSHAGLQQTTPPTNTKFRPSFLRTPAVTLYTKTYMQKASYLKSTVTHQLSPRSRVLPPAKTVNSLLFPHSNYNNSFPIFRMVPLCPP